MKSCKLHKTTEEVLHDKLNMVLLRNCFDLTLNTDHVFLQNGDKNKIIGTQIHPVNI